MEREREREREREKESEQWRRNEGGGRPGCHSLGGDTQSRDQCFRNDTNGM